MTPNPTQKTTETTKNTILNKFFNKTQQLWDNQLRDIFLRWSFLVGSLISIAFTLWLAFPDSDKLDTGGISNFFNTVLTPAGFTFAIWSLIYIVLIAIGTAIGLRQVKLNMQGNIFYLLSCMWICLWSVFWTALDPVLSGLALVMIMGFNVATFGQLAASNTELLEIKPRFYNVITSGFLLYVGWTIVAAVINITIALQYGFGFTGFGIAPEIWRIAIIAVAVAINLWLSYRVRNFTTLAVLAWAIFGIWMKIRD